MSIKMIAQNYNTQKSEISDLEGIIALFYSWIGLQKTAGFSKVTSYVSHVALFLAINIRLCAEKVSRWRRNDYNHFKNL